MAHIMVSGLIWDVASIDGKTVTFVDGGTTTVSEKTQKEILAVLSEKPRARKPRAKKKKA